MRFVEICSFKIEERASRDPLADLESRQMVMSQLNDSEEKHKPSSHVMVAFPGIALDSFVRVSPPPSGGNDH